MSLGRKNGSMRRQHTYIDPCLPPLNKRPPLSLALAAAATAPPSSTPGPGKTKEGGKLVPPVAAASASVQSIAAGHRTLSRSIHISHPSIPPLCPPCLRPFDEWKRRTLGRGREGCLPQPGLPSRMSLLAYLPPGVPRLLGGRSWTVLFQPFGKESGRRVGYGGGVVKKGCYRTYHILNILSVNTTDPPAYP